MFFEEKLEQINNIINQIDKEKRILVWGMGLHTDELMKYTNLLSFPNLMFTGKGKLREGIFGKLVVRISELDLDEIDCIVISSWKFQEEIEETIKAKGFKNKIIKLYQTEVEGEFFRLPHLDEREGIYFEGNYPTWRAAENTASGYDAPEILEKVYTTTLKVINGEAKYERDSVAFYETAYTYHLMMVIGILCSQKETINIIDYGGALGSLYWQNKEILDEYVNNKFFWHIVEQSNYVQCGRTGIQNENISFWDSIDEVERADLVIFSGVLQYLENYKEVIQKVVQLKPKYILVDRTFVAKNSRIVVQHVNQDIYEGAYPAKIFGESEIADLLNEYRLLVEFPSFVDSDEFVDGMIVKIKGMIFKLK